MMTYDPAFTNTAACRSRITFIDGDKGILLYRGYPIEQLAEHSTYLETAYLILFGELPTKAQLDDVDQRTSANHTIVQRSIKKTLEGLPPRRASDGHVPQHRRRAGTFYPDAKNIADRGIRRLQSHPADRQGADASPPTRSGTRPAARSCCPTTSLSFTGNFLNMLFKMTEPQYKPNPVLERALDVLFILHADHEQNCSTHAMRGIGSSHVDPYSALAGAAAALYGPLHGGANEAVLRMLKEIGSMQNVPDFIKRVKGGEGRLMGFGHRVYKSYDPRAKIIKRIADQVFEVTGKNPLLDIALELERIALEDDYFVKRKLYPNVDFYSGLIYQAMGFPVDMFPVLFAIPRTAGWIAQWEEMLTDPEQKIARPRQIYVGSGRRDYVHVESREARRGRPCRARVPPPSWSAFGVASLLAAMVAASCAAQAPPAAPRRLQRHARLEDVRQLVAIGPRVAGMPGGRGAPATTSRSQLKAAGLDGRGAAVRRRRRRAAGARWSTCGDHPGLPPPRRPVPGARPAGSSSAGHYDTKLFTEFTFVGANDGGSSAAFLIELARALEAAHAADGRRAAVPRRRGSGRRVAGRRPHLRQPLLRAGGARTPARSRPSARSSWST